VTPPPNGLQRIVEHKTGANVSGLDHRQNNLHHPDLEQAGGVAKSLVVEDDMQPGLLG
jgi:hypothetical protein